MQSSKPHRRKHKLERITLEELLETSNMSGFVSFLDNKPGETVPLPHLVVDEPATTVVVEPPATVVDTPATTVVDESGFWRAEANGALFPAARIRRIQRAQDALTHAEESVYDCLWGTKNAARDDFRLVRLGYDRIASGARITKRNAALIIQRLIEKGFIQVESPAGVLERIPTQYRVFSYRAVMEEQTRRGRQWVVKSGNGVLYVHPVTVVTEPASTVVAPTTVTVVADVPTTVVAATTPIDNTNPDRKAPSSSPEETGQLAGIIARHLAVDADTPAALIQRCRAEVPDATIPEIAYFTQIVIAKGARAGDVRNWDSFLLDRVPRYFRPGGRELMLYRGQADQARRED